MTGLSQRIEAEGERRAWLGWERTHWTDEGICPDCGGNGCPTCDHEGVIYQDHNPIWDREDNG